MENPPLDARPPLVDCWMRSDQQWNGMVVLNGIGVRCNPVFYFFRADMVHAI